jgi:hypothetical protein
MGEATHQTIPCSLGVCSIRTQLTKLSTAIITGGITTGTPSYSDCIRTPSLSPTLFAALGAGRRCQLGFRGFPQPAVLPGVLCGHDVATVGDGMDACTVDDHLTQGCCACLQANGSYNAFELGELSIVSGQMVQLVDSGSRPEYVLSCAMDRSQSHSFGVFSWLVCKVMGSSKVGLLPRWLLQPASTEDVRDYVSRSSRY